MAHHALRHRMSVASVLLFALLVACLATCSSASGPPLDDVVQWEGEVIDLHDGNFAQNLEGREAVVEFYAPWCGQCRVFAPIYEKWAHSSYEHASGLSHVLIARLDCTLNPDVASKQRIQAYPTVRFYRDGAVVAEYEGARTEAALQAWLATVSKQGSLEPMVKGKRRTSAAATSAEQKRAQEHADRKASNTASSSSLGKQLLLSLLSDWFSLEVTDWVHLEQLLTTLLDAPRSLFASHPYMVLSAVWAIGLFQGLFLGICIAVRSEKR